MKSEDINVIWDNSGNISAIAFVLGNKSGELIIPKTCTDSELQNALNLVEQIISDFDSKGKIWKGKFENNGTFIRLSSDDEIMAYSLASVN